MRTMLGGRVTRVAGCGWAEAANVSASAAKDPRASNETTAQSSGVRSSSRQWADISANAIFSVYRTPDDMMHMAPDYKRVRPFLLAACFSLSAVPSGAQPVVAGADRLFGEFEHLVRGKRIALVSNHSGRLAD